MLGWRPRRVGKSAWCFKQFLVLSSWLVVGGYGEWGRVRDCSGPGRFRLFLARNRVKRKHMNQTIILGAGLSGLGAAMSLPHSLIYEAKSHVGGHVYSHKQSGIYFDEGAHICHAKDENWKQQLFANAGEVITVPQSKVSNWWHGTWITYPVQNHLRDLPAALRDQALREILAAQEKQPATPPANYDQWCRAQYGDYLTDHFYREYTEKYWRVSMAEMDIDWLTGRLLPSQIERISRGRWAKSTRSNRFLVRFTTRRVGDFFVFSRSFTKGWRLGQGFRLQVAGCRKESCCSRMGNRFRLIS